MDTSKIHKSKSQRFDPTNGFMTSNEINMNEVRDFTKKLTDDKKEILESSFDEIKKLTKELNDLKFQNEEMEVVIKDVIREKDHIEVVNQELRSSYDTLSVQYSETKKLLHESHNQNIQMSKILEKMRENESCLIAETQKLRKYGSLQDTNTEHKNNRTDSIVNLEKEVKYWQREAERLSQIIEINDNKAKLSTTKQSLPPKKTSKDVKRYKKIINRSHSVESSQRKSKELEFEKLNAEKLQLKHLLNDLERQVAEIQNNVIQISDERQKYKEFYYAAKDKFERVETKSVDLERILCDETNECSKLSRENKKLSKELDAVLQDGKKIKITNENLRMEMSEVKSQHSKEIQIFESKLSCLAKENHDIGVRSTNLKDSIISLEGDFKEMEQELQKKSDLNKDYCDKITELEKQIAKRNQELNEKTDFINESNNELISLKENILKLRRIEESLSEKLDSKTKEVTSYRCKTKENDETIQNMKSSFSAHVVKLENQIKNAEQIISSKIKLISCLELKVANSDKELKMKDDEIVYFKKLLNTKENELETMIYKYNEANDGKKNLEECLENLSSDHKTVNFEVATQNDIIEELRMSDLQQKAEVKSLTEALNRKEDHLQIMDTQIERQEKEIPLKNEEITRMKKLISQLENEIDQKESHIGSLLSILESKEEKINSTQLKVEQTERMVNEYVEQLNNIDDCVIQSNARNNALEREIENLTNGNVRLLRQKDHLTQTLSEKNMHIGQLQVQLANKQESCQLENIRIIKDFDEDEKNEIYYEMPYSKARSSRKSRGHDLEYTPQNSNVRYHTKSNGIPKKIVSDHYDKRTLKNRTQSINDDQ